MKKIIIFLLMSTFFCYLFSCKHKDSENEKPVTVTDTTKKYPNQILGVDVSVCQEKIDWKDLVKQRNYKIKFAIIRVTMGDDRKDRNFIYNFEEAKNNQILVGLYHYYDPNENSVLQAKNYLRVFGEKKTDFRPILDIERLGKIQPKARLLLGIRRWLNYVENNTGHRPIIYTSLSFYKTYLSKGFSKYPRWLAAYSDSRANDEILEKSEIRQFTDKKWIKGLRKHVKIDINIITDSTKLRNVVIK